MEEITTFFIYTPWRQSHKWDVDGDGLVEYNQERITPREVSERFTNDYPMFTIIRAEVCKRIINPDPDAERPYRWITLERFQ